MYTYQDFLKDSSDISGAVLKTINAWKGGEIYKTALLADEYDAQRNYTINNYVKTIYSIAGQPIEDFTASNNKIACNFFHRLNTQRNMYSLGNGISFNNPELKDKFGTKFDNVIQNAGYYALIHGISFVFVSDRCYEFKATEFAPLWDEDTGEMKAGVRFWQVDKQKPMYAVLYEEDGYTKFSTVIREENSRERTSFVTIQDKKPYRVKVSHTEAFGDEIIGEERYSALPVVPLWGSKLHQSTLIGMQSAIDSYDLIRSGFANDLTDCSEIYWIVENYGGMSDSDLARFRDRLKINHIVQADTSSGGKITPYTQEVPYQARKQYLDDIRSGIYEDFGGLDVHVIAAGATNDHIDAAYEPLDENADDFEYNLIECITQIGALLGISEEDATPIFKRRQIKNQHEVVEILSMESAWLDEETIISKLPNVTIDEVKEIMERKEKEDIDRTLETPETPEMQTDEQQEQQETQQQ